ncbi:MAG: MnhB domain-containing protein [Candidatus Rokuibacteriota bacterium]
MTTALTRAVARLLLPATLVTAAALLVRGYAETGDGFIAGVMAAIGIVMQYVAFGARAAERLLPVRLAPAALVFGLLLALAVAFAPLLGGAPLLAHVPRPGGHVISLGALELHTAVAFDLGVCLAVLGFAVGVVRAIARTESAETR